LKTDLNDLLISKGFTLSGNSTYSYEKEGNILQFNVGVANLSTDLHCLMTTTSGPWVFLNEGIIDRNLIIGDSRAYTAWAEGYAKAKEVIIDSLDAEYPYMFKIK
jgi:hypothetical protein